MSLRSPFTTASKPYSYSRVWSVCYPVYLVKLLLLLTRIIDDVDEASAFLRRAEAQLIVAQKENGHVPAAEEALIELDATIKELRGVLANEDTGDAADIDHPLDTSQT